MKYNRRQLDRSVEKDLTNPLALSFNFKGPSPESLRSITDFRLLSSYSLGIIVRLFCNLGNIFNVFKH